MDSLENAAIPPEYLCPITAEVMWDPVFTKTGHSYSRQGITEWFRENNTDPNTGTRVSTKIVPNIALRGIIRERLAELGVGKVTLQEYRMDTKTRSYIPSRTLELFPWEFERFSSGKIPVDGSLLDPARPDMKYIVWLRGTYDPESFYQGLRFTPEPTRAFILSDMESTEIRVSVFARNIEGTRIRTGFWAGAHSMVVNARLAYTTLTERLEDFPKLTPDTAVVAFRMDDSGAWIPFPDNKCEHLGVGDLVTMELFRSAP